MSEKRNIIGIDLGTTNTVVAKGNKTSFGYISETIEITQFNEGKNIVKSKQLPSVLYKPKNEDVKYVGIWSKAQKIKLPHRTISNAKRFMGLETTWKIDNEVFSPKDIASEILKVCKINAEKQFINKKIDGVTITVPASFTNDQIRDTREAAIKAGFFEDGIKIISEPTAAMISYINDLNIIDEDERPIDFSKPKNILVFDIGGGTCDVCVIEITKNDLNIIIKEKAVGRYEELGGVDFDKLAAEKILNIFLNENKISRDDLSPEEYDIMSNKLLVFAEKAKEKFSIDIDLFDGLITDDESIYEYTFENFYKNTNQKFTLSKKQFDEATESLYHIPQNRTKDNTQVHKEKNIEDPIINTLKDYKISAKDIDYVYLTGGMSQYKNIKEKVKEILKLEENKIIYAKNPMDVCAMGAAIYHYYSVTIEESNNYKKIAKSTESGIVTDIKTIISESIMIDLVSGLPQIVIPKGTQVPCKGNITGKFKTSSPSGIKINIYAGEDNLDSQMRIQKSWRTTFNTPVQTGTDIDIQYSVDEFKELRFKIIVKDFLNQEFELTTNEHINIEQC